jgi:ubiquinone/menaquinone biosynthesis C-methylase UbiE
MFGKIAGLAPNQTIIDVGSGFASPAALWSGEYSQPDITCVNINFEQLRSSKRSIPQDSTHKIRFVNSTARILPFKDCSVDRVLALESAQHFKPLGDFVSESYRMLKKGGVLAMAIPVVERPASFVKLGILSMTWSSEHYGVDYVESVLEKQGFDITSVQKIGSSVYEPLADYYIKNRQSLKQKILEQYQSYVEKILYISMQKMRQVSEDKVIDYLLVSCKK